MVKWVKVMIGGVIWVDWSVDDLTSALLEALREYVVKCGG